MTNKKGFTLIELIAVIVILSLIALIVFPAINSVIKDSKEKAYNQQIQAIVKAAKQLSYEHSEVLPDEIDGASYNLELNCLTTGCTLENGKKISGGYLNEDELINPKKTSENLKGVVEIKYNSKRYDYTYKENTGVAAKNTTGTWLLKNSKNKAVLKANNNTYKGTNAGNYINFSGSTWRILKINSDNTITIIKNTPAIKLAYDNNGVIDFENSTINTYLNNTYYNALSQKSYIKPYSYCVGPGDNACSQKYTANVGLVTIKEYMDASNDTNCSLSNLNACANGNFLVTNEPEYTMNYGNNQVFILNNGTLTTINPNTVLNIRPVVTLKEGTKITSGSGTVESPFLIS